MGVKSVVGNILHSNDAINPLRAMGAGSMRQDFLRMKPKEPALIKKGMKKSNIAGVRI